MPGILRYITDGDESRLLAGATRTRYEHGQTIVAEGDHPRRLFILRRGAARVERNHGGYGVEISRLGEGELFGEMSFVEDFPASASVVAQGPCEVDAVDESHVHALAEADPAFAGRFYRSIAEVLSRRLRATSVDALSEFSWGTGSFRHPDVGADAAREEDGASGWGGGSPLRGDDV